MASFTDYLTRDFFSQNPAAALQYAFPKAGGTDPFAQFLRGSQSRLYDKYLSKLPEQPNLDFLKFLGGQDMAGQFQMMAPSQRGQSIYSPRVRFIGF